MMTSISDAQHRSRSVPTVTLVWIAYLALSALTLVSWTINGWHPVTGDEPHYLIIADGIIQDRTLEQTKPYAREFNDRDIFPSGLAPPGSQPSPQNTHAIEGPHGLFNVHNIGLPILLALPFLLAGILGAKAAMIGISSFAVLLGWKVARFFTASKCQASLVLIAAVFSPTMFIAGNQIYPDITAGVISLYVIYRIFVVNQNLEDEGKSEYLACLVIAVLPWLQIKLVAPAIILAVGLTFARVPHRLRWSILWRVWMPLVVSLAGLATYNNYAFGNPTGPYSDGALELSLHSLMVFVGLHIDKAQGLLIQQPVYLIGVLFLVPFVNQYRLVGAVVLLCYASLLVPNAMHPNWYGGLSFAGRFAWSGALVILPVVLFGVSRVIRDNRAGVVAVVLLILFNLYTYYHVSFSQAELYNRSLSFEWLSLYPSFHPWLSDYLPVLSDPSTAYRYPLSGLFIIFVIGLLLIGIGYNREVTATFYRRLSLFLVAIFACIAVMGQFQFIKEPPIIWQGGELPSQVGERLNGHRIADDTGSTGYITYGPYISLPQGEYRFDLSLVAESEETEKIGYIDVFLPAAEVVLERADILPGLSNIGKDFSVPPRFNGEEVEIRVFYNGEGRLEIHRLTLSTQ